MTDTRPVASAAPPPLKVVVGNINGRVAVQLSRATQFFTMSPEAAADFARQIAEQIEAAMGITGNRHQRRAKAKQVRAA